MIATARGVPRRSKRSFDISTGIVGHCGATGAGSGIGALRPTVPLLGSSWSFVRRPHFLLTRTPPRHSSRSHSGELLSLSESRSCLRAVLVFQSKKATGDDHDKMTSEHFEEWFHDSLMPNIPPKSVVVIDNAPYHCRRLEPVPTMSSRKQIMQDWPTVRGIEFPENALKRELYTLIKMSDFTPKYAVDEMAKTAGHEVVHHITVTIELALSQMKRFIKENNLLFTLTAIKELTYRGLDKVGPANLKKLVEHVTTSI